MSNPAKSEFFSPAKANPIQKKQSVLLFKCRKCKLPHEVKPGYSSQYCEGCRPVARCLHGVKVAEPCQRCLQVHPNGIYRIMPH